jgi:hypothetical protein|tara:strand:- start:2837 stop:3511 length:675 start_codon:yes stop_codon:yes gene_type:complete
MADEQEAQGTDEGTEDTGITVATGENSDSEASKDTTITSGNKEVDEQENTEESEAEDTKGDEAGKSDVPEKYDEFRLPEGLQMSEQRMTDFSEFAKDLGLTQEGAQQAIDFWNKAQLENIEAEKASHEASMNEWKQETLKDEIIGGNNIDETIANAAYFLQQYDTDDSLKELFETTGIGNNVAVVRLVSTLGGMMKEDGILSGAIRSGIETPVSAAKKMFPSAN